MNEFRERLENIYELFERMKRLQESAAIGKKRHANLVRHGFIKDHYDTVEEADAAHDEYEQAVRSFNHNYKNTEVENKKNYRIIYIAWRKELVGDKDFIKLCRDKVLEHEAELKEVLTYIDEMYREYIKAVGDEKEGYQWVIDRAKTRRLAIEKDLRKWNYELKVAKGSVTRDKAFDIEKAKAVPIELLLGKSVAGTSARRFYACPLHSDKTPSMCWYVLQNKVHCFSCQFNGDAIDLFMKMNGTDFKTAVLTLLTY